MGLVRALNIFMNVWPERSGELHVDPPASVAGGRFSVRAEMDLHGGLTACTAETSNGEVCKPIAFVVTGGSAPPAEAKRRGSSANDRSSGDT